MEDRHTRHEIRTLAQDVGQQQRVGSWNDVPLHAVQIMALPKWIQHLVELLQLLSRDTNYPNLHLLKDLQTASPLPSCAQDVQCGGKGRGIRRGPGLLAVCYNYIPFPWYLMGTCQALFHVSTAEASSTEHW